MLKPNARVVPHGQLVRIYEPTMQRYIQVQLIECRVAQLMDGRRGLDELEAIGLLHDQSFTRAALESLVLNLNGAGLLNRVAAEHASTLFDDDELSALTEVSPVEVAAEPPRAPALRVVRTGEMMSPREPREDRDQEDPTVVAAASDELVEASAKPAEAYSTPDEAPDEAPAEAAPEEETADPADEVRRTEIIAAQEQAAQDALWTAARARKWHQRTLVRVLLVLAVITGLAAVIPYPLRVTSECTIIPSERAKVRAELQGVLVEILVDEGDTVKKGQILARLDDRALKAERLGVVAELEKIEAELATLRQGRRPEEIEQQKAILAARRNEVAFAGKEARRRTQMVREGVGSRHQSDEASRELVSRRRAVEEAAAALRLLEAGSRPEEIAAQEAVRKRQHAQLAYIDERLAMTVVRAPIEGEIQTPRFRERLNEGVEAGGLVCEIANIRRVRAEVLVPEREVDSIALGMPAVVKVESYPSRPFEGKVNFIAPAVDGQDKRVRVVVELDNTDRLLKANMTGFGEIEAGDRSLLTLATRRVTRWIRVRFLL